MILAYLKAVWCLVWKHDWDDLVRMDAMSYRKFCHRCGRLEKHAKPRKYLNCTSGGHVEPKCQYCPEDEK